MPLVTKAADERLNQLNFQMATLRFGMATEIAAHAPFGKSSSALKKVETGLTIQLKVWNILWDAL